MIENNTSQEMEIQIEDEKPFIPEKIIRAGNVFKEEEREIIAGIKSIYHVVDYGIVHVLHNGVEINKCYKKGTWASGTNGMARFHVRGLLAVKTEEKK